MSFARKPEPAVRKSTKVFVPTLLVRTAIVGLVAIAGAVWALVRHFTHELPPLRVPVRPVPSAAPTYDADAGEVPVPEIFEQELERDGR